MKQTSIGPGKQVDRSLAEISHRPRPRSYDTSFDLFRPGKRLNGARHSLFFRVSSCKGKPMDIYRKIVNGELRV